MKEKVLSIFCAVQKNEISPEEGTEMIMDIFEEFEREDDPYNCFPQCDVEGCLGVSANGGGCWRETGYWNTCSEHSKMCREGKPQPTMKAAALQREAGRDENGFLQY